MTKRTYFTGANLQKNGWRLVGGFGILVVLFGMAACLPESDLSQKSDLILIVAAATNVHYTRLNYMEGVRYEVPPGTDPEALRKEIEDHIGRRGWFVADVRRTETEPVWFEFTDRTKRQEPVLRRYQRTWTSNGGTITYTIDAQVQPVGAPLRVFARHVFGS